MSSRLLTVQTGAVGNAAEIAGILAKSPGAAVGAVLRRGRAPQVAVDAKITAPQRLVMVTKVHTEPKRVEIVVGTTSSKFPRGGTLELIKTATSGSIRFFDAEKEGNELLNDNITARICTSGELNAGFHMFAQGDKPSGDLDDVQLKLTLDPGPTTGDTAQITLTAVELTLDISPPRNSSANPFTPLPQPQVLPPNVTPTDKWFAGVLINAQDPDNTQPRAQLIVRQVKPPGFDGELVLRQVGVVSEKAGKTVNRAQLFENEIPGPKQTPKVTEKAKTNPFFFKAKTITSPDGRQFFIEGKTVSATLRDTAFQLGIKNVENDGDRVAFAVAVAPLITADSKIVVAKKAHTNPSRRKISLRTSAAFDGKGTLKRLDSGPIKFFDKLIAGIEIDLTGTGREFSPDEMKKGVDIFAESANPSSKVDECELTFSLEQGPKPVGGPATLALTAFEITLSIFAPRETPGVTPAELSSTEKIKPGRFVIAQDAKRNHQRARIVVQPPNPSAPVGTFVLEPLEKKRLQLFTEETPAPGQKALTTPHTIDSDLVKPGGAEFFIEGKNAGKKLGDTGFRLGIQKLEKECDRVVMTVLPDPSLPGPFLVGEHDYTGSFTIPDTTETIGIETAFDFGIPVGATVTIPSFDVNLTALVRYPAKEAGKDKEVAAELPKYPLIIIAHGNHTSLFPDGKRVGSFTGLEYLARHFATYGYIAVSIDLDDMNLDLTGPTPTEAVPDRDPAIIQRGLTVIEHIKKWVTFNASDPIFKTKVDIDQIGLLGHSRGGETVVSAHKTNIDNGLGHKIKGVVSIAPTDFLGFVLPPPTPYLVIYGSADNDVSVGWPFRLYDRASPPKAMIFVYGAMHNRFSTHPDWLGKIQCPPRCEDSKDGRAISRPAHLDIAKGYSLGFFELFFRNQQDHQFLFKRYGRPSTVAAAVELHHQVQDTTRKVVDDFELPLLDRANPLPPQLAANAKKNSLNLDVDQVNLATPSGLDKPLTEASLRKRDLDFFWHETVGTMIAWDTAGAKYTTEVGGLDVSTFQVLSFRVTQRLGSALNPSPAGLAPGSVQDFSVSLIDSANRSASVAVSTITTIPFPYKRFEKAAENKSALKTIRIPLSAFTAINGALDLKAIKTVAFELNRTPKGEVAVDDIEFSN
jgi:dienelactone hydrolase